MIKQGPNDSTDRNSPHRKSVQLQSKHMLQIFQSDDFTGDQLIEYFIDTFDEPGPHQFLTNKLLSQPDRFVEYYIPQFCYMQVKNYSFSMDNFLEDLCKRSISNYLKINWCLHAYAEDDREAPDFQRIERKIEAAMVNSAFQMKRIEILSNQDSVDFHIKLQKLFQEKELRFNYVSSVARFVHHLVKISLDLKQLPPPQRKESLAISIKQGNKLIRKQRNAHQDLKYYWGMMLPFQRSNDFEPPSNLIVRIVPSDYACFNTKTRVPYRILVETISQEEIEEKSALLNDQATNDSSAYSESDSFIDDISLSLEAQMRDLTKAKMEDEIFEKLNVFSRQESGGMNQQAQQTKPLRRSHSWAEGSNTKEIGFLKNQRLEFDIPNIKNKLLINESLVDQQEKTVSECDKPRKRSMDVKFLRQRASVKKKQLLLSTIEQDLDEINIESCNNHPKIIKKNGPWEEDWDDKYNRIKSSSPFKDFESYKLRPIIVKGGDDLRQEMLAMQIIQKIEEAFRKAYLNLYLKPYEIIITSENSGILEYVPNTLSMDGLKKIIGKNTTLKQFYSRHFQEDTVIAQKNFVESLAGYSLITYLLQIKDRHNGNILIDNQGHIVHIDFGFLLSNSPGNMNFESAPFKLTKEYIELMNGTESQFYQYFCLLMVRGFLEIRKHTAGIVQLVKTMMEKSNFPCFKNFNLEVFRERFKETHDEYYCEKYIHDLIEASRNNWRTVQYDNFQRLTNGIEP